jgi:hypothetical protein
MTPDIRHMDATEEHVWEEHYAFPWSYCTTCGMVPRRDGLNKPCRGPVKLRELECPDRAEPENENG